MPLLKANKHNSKWKYQCDNCGVIKEKYVNIQSAKQEHHFCSVKCRNEFGYIEIPCNFCGTVNTYKKSSAEKYLNHFCNLKCRHAHERGYILDEAKEQEVYEYYLKHGVASTMRAYSLTSHTIYEIKKRIKKDCA